MMTIKLAITDRPMMVLEEQEISLGSAPHCTISFLNYRSIQPKHAVIRMVAGRWLVEARDGEAVYVTDGAPKRLQWLKPGDVIRLSPDGPAVTFEPRDDAVSPDSTDLRSAAPPPLPSTRTVSGFPLAGQDSSKSTDGIPLTQGSPLSTEAPLELSRFEIAKSTPEPSEFSIASIASTIEADRPPANEIVLSRLTFDSPASPSDSNDFDETPRVETDSDWIVKVIVRIGFVGLAILVALLFIRELKK